MSSRSATQATAALGYLVATNINGERTIKITDAATLKARLAGHLRHTVLSQNPLLLEEFSEKLVSIALRKMTPTQIVQHVRGTIKDFVAAHPDVDSLGTSFRGQEANEAY